MDKKTAIFKKTETNSTYGFLSECIKFDILTTKKAQAIYAAVRDSTVEAMRVITYSNGSVYVKTYRTSKLTGETIAHEGFMKKQSIKLTLSMTE